jgi:hypothetical protein
MKVDGQRQAPPTGDLRERDSLFDSKKAGMASEPIWEGKE